MKMVLGIATFILLTSTLGAENYHHSLQPNFPDNSVNQEKGEVTIKVTTDPKLGKILTDSKGKTLYIFRPDRNKNGSSTCYGNCAVAWPPLLVTSEKPILEHGIAGSLNTIKRNDNTSQVTYNGMPLYYYIKDKKPGDVNGQNVENKWFVVNPR